MPRLLLNMGKHILLDPMLSDKGSFDPFPNSPRQDQKSTCRTTYGN